MKARFASVLVLALIASTAADSRTSANACGPELAGLAHIIAIATAEKISQPGTRIPGVDEIAVLRVTTPIRGLPESEATLKLVTRGFSGEQDPDCCETGVSYLVLAQRGYPVFEEIDGESSIILKGTDEFISSVGGRHGVFRIEDGVVQGWRCEDEPGCGSKLAEIVDTIRNDNDVR